MSTGLEPQWEKVLWISSAGRKPIFSVSRRQRCRLASWILKCRDIISTGTTPKKKVITLQFDDFYFVTVYTPNSQDELKRLDYRMKWEDDFLAYLKKLEETKPVIYAGDLNVARLEIDLKNPKNNRRNAGFTDEERSKIQNVIDSGFIDTFRYFYPDLTEVYSWWSYRFKARERNAGWRIDYFMVSGALKDRLKDAKIHTEVMGSDHCPIELDLK